MTKDIIKEFNRWIIDELNLGDLPTWKAQGLIIFLSKALTQARADERKKVLEEIEKKGPTLHNILLEGYIAGRKGKLYYQHSKFNNKVINRAIKDLQETLKSKL